MTGDQTPRISDDLVEPFEIEPFHLRGRLVRLGPVLDTIVKRHDYPPPVATMLGEAIVLAVALASALKYDGVFTLQTKGDGPIRLLVADVTTTGAVRGYAQYDAAKLAQVAVASGDRLGAAAPGRGLSRLHRRPGRAHRALSGHRRARGRDARRVHPSLFSPVRADRRRDQGGGRPRRGRTLARRLPDDRSARRRKSARSSWAPARRWRTAGAAR